MNFLVHIPTVANTVAPAEHRTAERAPGNVVKVLGKHYKLVESDRPGSCIGCDLYINRICQKNITCLCTGFSRSDKLWIHFKIQNR